jgi:glucose-6-phosphate isomerase
MASPLFVDTSFSQISETDFSTLYQKILEKGFVQKRDDLFSGKKINLSENRPALHTALRNLSKTPIMIDGVNVMPAIEDVWKQIKHHSNQFVGVTDIIHIGIGGSDFGPRLVCDALKYSPASTKNHLRVHFVSNVDSSDLASVLENIDVKRTRIIIVSKAFTTVETLQNAKAVLAWMTQQSIQANELSQMIFAITANPTLAKEFGVLEENILPFWDWVGGRFSVWSAVGLPIALKFGYDTYMNFLAGAHAMDQHFLDAAVDTNQPLRLALILYHQQKSMQVRSQAIIPYAQSLNLFPHWLQQLEMESNGKTAGIDGKPVPFSAPVIFGIPGTNAQHSFFQMLHQGPEVIPVDLIAVHQSMSDLPHNQDHHQMLWANCLAQSQAFAMGQGDPSDLNHYYPGQRPNNLIVLPKLDAYHLGALMALYEHRTFCLGLLYGLNSFDQPGVELGKKLAIPIQAALDHPNPDYSSLHPITAKRIAWLKNPTYSSKSL